MNNRKLSEGFVEASLSHFSVRVWTLTWKSLVFSRLSFSELLIKCCGMIKSCCLHRGQSDMYKLHPRISVFRNLKYRKWGRQWETGPYYCVNFKNWEYCILFSPFMMPIWHASKRKISLSQFLPSLLKLIQLTFTLAVILPSAPFKCLAHHCSLVDVPSIGSLFLHLYQGSDGVASLIH